MIPNHGPAMDFGLGETADAIRETTARFAADRIAPIAAEIDRDNTFPRQLWPQMGALGLHGITVEEEFGGLGLGYLEHVVAMEEVSPRLGVGGALATAPTPTSASTRSAAGARTSRSAAICRKLISGEHVGALAMSEAGAGSDVISMRLRAERRGDRYVLNGTKFWITNGPHADVAGGLRQDRSGGRLARRHRLHHREGLHRLLAAPRSSTRSACAAPTPASWCSRTARCPSRERARARERRRGRADERARLRAHGAGRRAARHHAGLPGRGAALRARAPAVRPADRHVPADAGQDRRHVRRAELGARLRLRRGQGVRRRPAPPASTPPVRSCWPPRTPSAPRWRRSRRSAAPAT